MEQNLARFRANEGGMARERGGGKDGRPQPHGEEDHDWG